MKYTLKSLIKWAQEELEDTGMNDPLWTIKDWYQDGRDLMQVFDNMSRKETLQIIDSCIQEDRNLYSNHKLLSDIYKIAITSLEKRL